MYKELVTVYITTHNRKSQVRRAIDSVINQKYKHVEIIVVDDGSSDGTEDYLIDYLNDGKIIYIRNDEPQGACYARNLAINIATGYFITGLDDDDEFTEDRVLNFISEWSESYSFISSNFLEIYKDGRKKVHYKRKESYLGDLDSLLIDNICSNQIFTKTQYLRDIGGFDIRAKRFQDWDTWIRLSSNKGRFYCSNAITYYMYHDHINTDDRVSKKYPLSSAIRDLVYRNEILYTKGKIDYMLFLAELSEIKGGYIGIILFLFNIKNARNFLCLIKNKIRCVL